MSCLSRIITIIIISILWFNLIESINSSSSSGSVNIDSSSLIRAREYNDIGIELASSNKLKLALKQFENAIKLNNGSAEYYNNYGVTLMRLKEFDKARQQFKYALKLQYDHVDAKQNLHDLEKYMKSKGLLIDDDTDQQYNQTPIKSKKKKKNKKRKPKDEDDDEDNELNEAEDSITNNNNGNTGYPHPVTGILRRANTNKRMKLSRIDIKDLYKPENSEYALGYKPYIIINGLKDFDIKNKWTLDYFSEHFADTTADFYPHNMDESSTHPYLTPLKRAIQELIKPSQQFPSNQRGHPGTYIQWNVHYKDWLQLSENMINLPYYFHRDDEWIEKCFSTPELRDEFLKRTHWRMILIGNKGAGMFNHQDVLRTASWQAQVAGRKRWHICAPTESQYLYSAGKVDCFDPDYINYPLFHHANCYEDIVEAGEMISYPQSYWHQTENLESPSIALSGTILDEHTHTGIAEELSAECTRQKYNWHFSQQLCTELNQCFNWWRNRYNPHDTNQDTCPAR